MALAPRYLEQLEPSAIILISKSLCFYESHLLWRAKRQSKNKEIPDINRASDIQTMPACSK